MPKIYNHEIVKGFFDKAGCKLLESEYKDQKTPMRYICNCGKENVINLHRFLQGQRCMECGKKKSIKSNLEKRKEKVLNELEHHGYILKSEYKRFNSKMNIVCKKGHNLYISHQNLARTNFRCKECSKKKGRAHHNYKHGKARKSERVSTRYNKWRDLILKTRGRKCHLCGSKDKPEVHHLSGFHWDKKNRYEFDNGIVLCKEHHKAFHKTYGQRWIKPNQFKEYSHFYKYNHNKEYKELYSHLIMDYED
jgi:hypothetical protein